MTTESKKKFEAVVKIGLGTVRMASGVATCFGHGLLGAMLRRPGHMQTCIRVGTMCCKGGLEMFQEGCREFKS